MDWKKALLGFSFLAFVGFTAYVLYLHGFIGFFKIVGASWATIQLWVDLAIALVFLMIWMVRDARERGVSPTPYVILTLFVGSIGPMLYLLLRKKRPSEVKEGT